MNIETLKKNTKEIHPWLIEVRNDFHQYPELGKKEFRTQQKISEYLTEMGIKHTKIAGTGIVGIIEGKGAGKVVAIRADIDALPMQDKKNVPYKSRNEGMMHACGHDAHTTILLGTAKILNDIKDTFCGTIKLFFQPDEEGSGGAEIMINEGCMENPEVDYVIGLHVMGYLECGKIEIKYGKLNAASDSVKVKVMGKTSHGAYPDKGIDAIVISANIINALQTLISRNVSPFNSVVLSFGKINGGEVGNSIADEVVLTGTLRTLDKGTREFCRKRIEEITIKTAEAFGGTAEVKISSGYEPLINNDEIVDEIKKIGEELLGMENIEYKEFPSLGAEDFSYFLSKAKGAFYHLGCANKSKGISSSIHSSSFDIDPDALLIGVRIQVLNALNLLKK